MYPWYQNFDYDLRLSRDDELGIQNIYGKERETKICQRIFLTFLLHFIGGHSKWGQIPKGTYDSRPAPSPTQRPKVNGGHPTRNKPFNDGRPSTCDSSYDAISLIRDELFIFKGRYFWRVNSTPKNDNRLLKGYPSLITNMWQQLPPNLTHVDAVYEHNKEEIVFFIGNNNKTTFIVNHKKAI
jgi:hypothetical protein